MASKITLESLQAQFDNMVRERELEKQRDAQNRLIMKQAKAATKRNVIVPNNAIVPMPLGLVVEIIIADANLDIKIRSHQTSCELAPIYKSWQIVKGLGYHYTFKFDIARGETYHILSHAGIPVPKTNIISSEIVMLK